MYLQLQCAALLAAAWTAAAASPAEECQGVLHLLQGRSDAELAVMCRASFAPEVCRKLGNSLGAQPWSSQRIGESCSRFAVASLEMDERGLEASFEAKTAAKQGATPAPLEEAVATKLTEPALGEAAPAATAEQVIPGGAIGHLLSKTRDEKADEETEAKAHAAQEAQKAPLRTLMTPLKVHDVAAPDPKGKTSLAHKETQKSLKAPLRQAAPLEKHGLAETEPEKVHIARLTLRSAVERTERTLAETSSGIRLFGRVDPLSGPEGLSLTPVLGFGLLAVAATFVSLSVMRTRRRSAQAATSAAFLLDVEQDPMNPASTVVE